VYSDIIVLLLIRSTKLHKKSLSHKFLEVIFGGVKYFLYLCSQITNPLVTVKANKKSIIKIASAVIICPIALILLLAVALYIPPIQNWAVGIVSDYASEETGMDVKVGRVLLAFPIDLALDNIHCIKQNDSLPQKDTILFVQHAVVDVQLLPLLKKEVKVNELELVGAKLNTSDFIHEARIKGNIGRLALENGEPVAAINLNDYGVILSSAVLDNAHLNVELSDTVPEDTSKSENLWKIYLNDLSVSNSDVIVHMPGDSLQFGAKIGNLKCTKGAFDLHKGKYEIASISTQSSRITYDNNFEKYVSAGLDPNHIALNDLNFRIDSLSYQDPDLHLIVRHCKFKEQSGIELKSLVADITLNSKQILVDGTASTPASKVTTRMQMDLNAFDNSNPGKIQAFIDASIGRTDLMLAMNGMPTKFRNSWPAHPLMIKGNIMGNMEEVIIPDLSIDLPTAFSLKANGNAKGFMNLTDNIYSRLFSANMHADIRTYNISFVKKLLDKSTARKIALPSMHAIADLDINGPAYNIKMKAVEGKGSVTAKAKLNAQNMTYSAVVDANKLQLNHFVKGMGLGKFSGTLKAQGRGTDYTNKNTQLNAVANIKQFQYGKYNLNNIQAKANINKGVADVNLYANNSLLKGNISLNALLNSKNIKTTFATELNNVDLYRLYLIDTPLKFSLCAHVDLETDLDKLYKVNGLLSDIIINDTAGAHHLDDIVFDVFTRRDTTSANIYCGDFETKLRAQGGYEWLMGCTDRLMTLIDKQIETRTIDQKELRTVFPRMNLYLRCGKENPIYNSVKYFDIDFNDIYANINTSREDGINGDVHLYGLKTQGYQIDTISVNLSSSNEPLDISYKAHIQNVKPNDYVFDVFLDGNLLEHGVSINGAFYDDNNTLGLKLGAEATMEEKGINFHLTPGNPVIAYEDFTLNDNNYILLSENNRIFADVKMKAADGTGIQLYSTEENEDALQDITLSLNHLNIGKLLSAIPYAPNVEGMLNGDFHFLQEKDESFSISNDMTVNNMIFEGCTIGNIGTQMVYMPKEDGSHYIDGHILLDEEEVGSVTGSYNFDNDAIDAKLNFMRFPMQLVNGFIPDQIIGLEGYAEGELTLQGTTVQPDVNGELFLESASLLSVPYGIKMRFDDDPVRIINSKLLFENFQMYASNNQPLIAQGSLDFNDTEHIMLNMRMKAENFLLIDAKETRKSEAYGKAFVNFYCMINGELDKLKIRGKLDVLSSTNLYYILKDSPLTTDNRLKELVTFTDFSSDEQVTIVRPTIEGINMDLLIAVNEGAHVKCWLNADHSNYLDLIGSGDLRMKYINDEINLVGKYTIREGEMKYSLPIIPLKTFTIASDSYIEFFGDVMNPRLNITATERVKSSCNIDGVNRLVTFDCGVVITKTLNDMGLQFIISAPEEHTISDQLAMMSVEERGKTAVTMLTTGMYFADGNTSNFSMNSALNTFLQSEINHIAGNALKTLDLSFGLDNSTEEDGTMHTDYTFKFAKRFWNNRLSISVGGKISSGPDVSGQNKSFFDNVEVQYRLSNTSNQYLNMFYKRSVYDFLEGYVGQYGAGYMYKKKLQHLSDLFKKTTNVSPTLRRNEHRDSLIKFTQPK